MTLPLGGFRPRATLVFVCLASLLVVPVAISAAQITTGTIAGRVADTQGLPIPGATVTITISAQGTRLASLTTDANGLYVAPLLPAGIYVVEAAMPGFRTALRTDVQVSGGDRVIVDLVPAIGLTETVDVRLPATLQAGSGERSSVIDTRQLESLPVASHDFQQFVALAPGVNGTRRIGGGGQDTYMIDGVSAMDTGNNGLLGGLNLPVDAVAEVKVLTSAYQAEFGRSSGLQISAVTRSGTNQLKWSVFSYQRPAPFVNNRWAEELNGYPDPVSRQFDIGYTLGGPVGRTGGKNRMFFFYSHEYRPQRAGRYVQVVRLPTALERQGDFSETRDANGVLFNRIYDPLSGLPKEACSATETSACFRDGGVLGRVPSNRLYGPGMALLNQYPLPNELGASGQGFNYAVATPVQTSLGQTPVIRLDYQALSRLRLMGKWAGQTSLVQPTYNTLPGFDDTLQKFPLSFNTSFTATLALGPATYLEASYGRSQNRLGSPPVSAWTDRDAVRCPPGLAARIPDCTAAALPPLFPDANVVDRRTYASGALDDIDPPFWEDGRILLPPRLAWAVPGTASRIRTTNCSAGTCAPPSLGFPPFLNINTTQDVVVSLTRVMGRHTAKAGFYLNHSVKSQNLNSALDFQGAINFGNDTRNPLDTGFPFANAAIGVFSSYGQQSRFIEGQFVYDNVEGYLQDSWRAADRLTIDYGVRFVHQTPQADRFGQTTNFFPDRWRAADAPRLYQPACAGAAPCTGPDRQAQDPGTGALLGPGTDSLIGQAVPGTGVEANGILRAGEGIADAGYVWPALGIAPRIGAAYDVRGDKTLVLRAAGGLFFDRPDGNTVFNSVANPPVASGLTQQWGRLSDLDASAYTLGPVPTVRVYAYDSRLPADIQWSAGVQLALPWTSSLDVSYVGHHAFDVLGGEQATGAVDLNTIDLGTTLSADGQDPTQPAGQALPDNLLRPYRGYGNILVQWGRFHRTFHSLQSTVTRRWRGNLSAGATWVYTIRDRGTTGLPGPRLRLDHADGGYVVRADQADAEALFADQGVLRHQLMANAVWAPPARWADAAPRRIAWLLRDWQVSGIFRFDTGAPYDVTYTYQTGGGSALTGSPDYQARIVIDGDAGAGCSSDQYRQFDTSRFHGPQAGSVGLESGRNLLHGCGDHRLDLSVQRSVKVWGKKELIVRADVFNVFDAVIYTARQTTAEFVSPSDQTLLNPQYLPGGAIDPARAQPNNAGFGAATNAYPRRLVLWQVRLKF